MAFVSGWNQKPLSGLALSASGLLALADLHTIAQRTAITGGASWMDSLLLAPGLHYQQAADELFRKGSVSSIVNIVDECNGSAVTLKLNNAATANYIQRVAKPGETVTLNVGRAVAARGMYKLYRSNSGNHATAWREGGASDLGWVSHVLYLASPLLTLAAITFIVLFKDWWALVSIMGLMTSRVLNIWVIKQRASHVNCSHDEDAPQGSCSRSKSTTRKSEKNSSSQRRRRLSLSATRQRIAQYLVQLGDAEHKALVRIRGKANDVRSITSRTWLRGKTHLEGYLEAIAKLIVYLVAALSGNMTQVGAMIMMTLLLTSAGLLALSNAKAKKLVVNGLAVAVVDGNTPSNSGGVAAAPQGCGDGAAGPSGTGQGAANVGVDGSADDVRGRSRQGGGGATAAVIDGGGAAGPVSSGGRGGGNPADMAERGQAGHVRWQK